MKKLYSSIKGLTLIEVLISLVIFTVLLLTGHAAITHFRNQNLENRNQVTASLLAQAKMEKLLNFHFTSKAWEDASHWQPVSEPEKINSLGITDPNGRFLRKWQILDRTPKENMKKIRVQVSWKNPKGKTKNIEFVSSKTRN